MNLSTAFFLQTFKGPAGRFKFVNRLITRSFAKKMGKAYYAVASGRNTGVYDTWSQCESEVKGYSGARYKKFDSMSAAQDFISENQSYGQHSRAPRNVGHSSYSSSYSYQDDDDYQPIVQQSRQPRAGPSSYSSSYNYQDDGNDLPTTKRRKTIMIDINKERNQDFKRGDNGFVDVYTDGACSSNGRKGAVGGVGVWFGDNHKLNVSRPLQGRPTNNRAEIEAVRMAVDQAKSAGIEKLRINTDSNFLISCMTKWMPSWKRNGWKTAKNEPVLHKEELLELEATMKDMDIAWNHVRGHAGIHGNEMADKLARDGCTKK